MFKVISRAMAGWRLLSVLEELERGPRISDSLDDLAHVHREDLPATGRELRSLAAAIRTALESKP